MARQQAHLGDDLGGELGEGDRRVAGIQGEGSLGRGHPLAGPLVAQVVMRCPGDQHGQPPGAGLYQHIRIGEAFQHGQVGNAEVAGERAHRQYLADQVLDAYLMLGCLPGQAVGGPHPAVQGRSGRVGQAQLDQPGGVDDPQPGQGVGVDPVGLGVLGEELPQI